MSDFYKNLIYLRGQKNLTQQELGDLIGVSPSQISRYEAGTAKPRKTVMGKLSRALGVSTDELLGSSPAHSGSRLYEGFSSRFLIARESANISMSSLAKMTGIEKSLLLDFEYGSASPKPDEVVRLADALDVPAENLFGAKDDDDVLLLRVVTSNDDKGDVVAVTQSAYGALVTLGENLGVSTNDAFNMFLEKFIEVANDPEQKDHPFMDVLEKMRTQK